jgi:hypothetical protein
MGFEFMRTPFARGLMRLAAMFVITIVANAIAAAIGLTQMVWSLWLLEVAIILVGAGYFFLALKFQEFAVSFAIAVICASVLFTLWAFGGNLLGLAIGKFPF